MNNLFLSIVFIVIAQVSVAAQTLPNPRTTPTPILTKEVDDAVNAGRDKSRRSDALRLAENFPVKSEKERRIYRNSIAPIYRKSTKEERAAIAPDIGLKKKYDRFLDGKNTGINRIAADIGCYSNDGVVSGAPECTKYTMPGAGSSYSFRVEDYVIFRLADLSFKKNKIRSLGVLTHGIMTNLGDVPIDSLDLKANGVKQLLKISPAADFGEAGAFANKLVKGYEEDGFIYASVLGAKLDNTYALRSIAYRGVSARNVKGLVFNELALDKRKDVVVVFRVVGFNEGKDITIVWKELRNKKAPKLKAPKK